MGNKRLAYLSKPKNHNKHLKRIRGLQRKKPCYSVSSSDCSLTDNENIEPMETNFSENEDSKISNTVENVSAIEELPELVLEPETLQERFDFSGRRIVNISYLFKSIQSLKHDGFGCTFSDMDIISERRIGFRSIFTTKCKMCNKEGTLSTEDPDDNQLDVTTAAVSGNCTFYCF